MALASHELGSRQALEHAPTAAAGPLRAEERHQVGEAGGLEWREAQPGKACHRWERTPAGPLHPPHYNRRMSDDLHAVGFTIFVATLSTLTILLPGVGAGLWLARYRGPGRHVLETLLSLPLVLPPTAVGTLLLDAFARRSWLGSALARAGVEREPVDGRVVDDG